MDDFANLKSVYRVFELNEKTDFCQMVSTLVVSISSM